MIKRRILVVGGTQGIGAAVVERLSAADTELVVTGRDEARLQQLATDTGCITRCIDVLAHDPWSALKHDLEHPLDGLIYLPGNIRLKPLARLTTDELLEDLRLHAVGAATAIQACLPALRKASGVASVVLISSVAARHGFPFHASVSMAKGALEGLVHALAAELAPHIRINAIAPSLTRTGLASGMLAREGAEAGIAAQHALKRIGEPADIAEAAVFLLSPASNWITGQVIGCDGGRGSLNAGR